MTQHQTNSLETIQARLDRSSAETFVRSIADELATLHDALDTIKIRLKVVQTAQTAVDRILSADPIIAFSDPPRSVEIDAAFPLSSDAGFHNLEYDVKGNPLRWTGPEPTFMFPIIIDRSLPLHAILRNSGLIGGQDPSTVRCFIDGNEAPVTVEDAAGEYELHFDLPTRREPGGTVLMFACLAVTSPIEVGQGADSRLLGLAFRWLKVSSV